MCVPQKVPASEVRDTPPPRRTAVLLNQMNGGRKTQWSKMQVKPKVVGSAKNVEFHVITFYFFLQVLD